jgi:hypothetical protein
MNHIEKLNTADKKKICIPPPPSKAFIPYVMMAEFNENPIDSINDIIITCLQLNFPKKSVKLSKQHNEHDMQLINKLDVKLNVVLNPLKQLFQN